MTETELKAEFRKRAMMRNCVPAGNGEQYMVSVGKQVLYSDDPMELYHQFVRAKTKEQTP